jgi:hypothetical protein
MKKFVSLFLIAVALVIGATPSAQALAPFKKAFQEKYVDGSDSEELKAAFKKESCNTCHLKGKKKEERNAYGDELEKLIEGNADERIKAARKAHGDAGVEEETAKILEELKKAFEEVAKKEDKNGEKYGDRIAAGKLPIDVE